MQRLFGQKEKTEESWHWVARSPVQALINVGDAMTILPNKELRSRNRRVVTAHEDQRQLDVEFLSMPQLVTRLRTIRRPSILNFSIFHLGVLHLGILNLAMLSPRISNPETLIFCILNLSIRSPLAGTTVSPLVETASHMPRFNPSINIADICPSI
jgi:hypothetical protein